jgi:hypothetical protein
MHDPYVSAQQLVLEADSIGPGGGPASPISPVVVEFTVETDHRLHVKISDPNKPRWEIPERCVVVYKRFKLQALFSAISI